MKIKFELNNREYNCNTFKPIDLSIPLLFNQEQPNTYNVARASAKAYSTGEFIGDTRLGGGCNFEEYRLIPHCNGTHTECVGHISLERIAVNSILKESFIPSTLITVNPEKAFDTNDIYIPEKSEEDMMITKFLLSEKLEFADRDFLEGLIIRTLPNSDSKKYRRYMDYLPPFFSIDAMEYIRKLNVKHLLMDIPSVDRAFDDGKLSTHHIFWDIPMDSKEADIHDHSMNTITEMIYAPDEVEDGLYLMNIQIPDFVSDAAPSRVFIYEIN